MKKFVTYFCLTLCLCMAMLTIRANAAEIVGINDASVFLKQSTTTTCTLSSTLMMFRRGALINGNMNWDSFTESNYKDRWWNGGLILNGLSGENMTASIYGGPELKKGDYSGNKQRLIAYLREHPEGIVVYYYIDFTHAQHAVLLTDYDEDADLFYCADPSGSVGFGRIPLGDSWIRQRIADNASYTGIYQGSLSNQDYVLANINQIWRITSGVNYSSYTPSSKSAYTTRDTYQIAAYCGKVIEVENSGQNNKSNVQIWENVGIGCQKFYIEPVDDSFLIRAVHSGKVIDIADGSSSSGTNIWQYGQNNTDAQKWKFEDAGDGYVYIRSALGTYMDVCNDGSANGTNIWAYRFNGSNAQKFKLINLTSPGLSPMQPTESNQSRYYLDVNGMLDSKVADNTDDYGTFDVYINGQLDGKNVSDYFTEWPVGTKYEIKNIRAQEGKKYIGIYTGEISGTITSKRINVALRFDSTYYLDINGLLDGKSVENTTNYGTFDVYINGQLDESGVTDYYKQWPLGTFYELKNISALSGKKYIGVSSGQIAGIMGNERVNVFLKFDSDGRGDAVLFSKSQTYLGQFMDVPANQWYTDGIVSAYEFGLMLGNSSSTFNPYGDVTVAEAITMAARIHSIYATGSENFTRQSGSAWYQPYLDYAYHNKIISRDCYDGDVDRKATRAQFAEIFAMSLPDKALARINSIADSAIPDVKSSDYYAPSVYKLYRAGILSGSDANGTFYPATYITRAEAATIVSRMADSSNRVFISL